ncbi:MAG: polysaccharide pyruvyl transferase family protein, partial [Bacteroidales bacterium]|nr:polysaccharide pyruvyl transferase family protein [Bacteroidales bacterium]
KYIDFDFINNHYKAAIIGGAGLLYNCFETFWVRFANECKLEYILWGVGGCYPDGERNPSVSPNVIKSTSSRLRLINVRDNLTAILYDFHNPYITACPSIFYLNKYLKNKKKNPDSILYCHHNQLFNEIESIRIREIISNFDKNYLYTDNIQTNDQGFYDILNLFLYSKLVITTRLHGAIIAYGLGIPYIAIPRDKKLREFCNLFGNGILIEDINKLYSAIENPNFHIGNIQLKPVIDFGDKAKKEINKLIS